jgi:elongation factor 1 alpha-like protein
LQIEVYHHSRDVPATATKLLATLDRANGKTIKANPRVITKGTSAELQLTLRSTSVSGAPSVVRGIPMELFSANKDMGRILIRRGGETIAAGIVLEIIN